MHCAAVFVRRFGVHRTKSVRLVARLTNQTGGLLDRLFHRLLVLTVCLSFLLSKSGTGPS
jgi:hypothetical protein